MKHTIKQICGWIGLALVIAVTAIAYNIPVTPVSASNTVTDTIQVTVYQPGTTTIEEPVDGSKTTSPIVNVSTQFLDDVALYHYVSYDKPGGGSTRELIDTFIPSNEAVGNDAIICDDTICSGTRKFSFNINDLPYNPSYGFYTIEAVGDASTSFSSITYTPVIPQITGYTSDNDPVVTYNVDEHVSYIKVQAIGADGNKLFGTGDGITVNVPAGATTFSEYLPFLGYNAKNQTYTIYFTAYDVNGGILYKSLTITFNYNREDPTPTPVVPDTGGGILFGNLNFSDSDYIITGLLVFLAVAAFATIIVLRRQRRH